MNIGNRINRPADVRTFKESDKLVDSSVYIGYEVEVEGLRKPLNLSGLWESKPDGSLRDNGIEYVFAHPLKGADVVTAVVEIMAALNKSKCSMSHRCGAHMHIDVRDMNEDTLASFIAHIVMFERAMYAYSGADRDSNIFCLPYYKAERGLDGFGLMLANRNFDYLFESTDKYYGVNLRAIQRYGSVEFRMLPGTLDVARVLTWINVLLSMRKAAVSMGSVDKFLHTVSSSGVLDYAAEVFAGVPEFLPYVKEHDMYKGMRLVQSFLNYSNLSVAYKHLPKKLGGHSLISKFAATHGLKIKEQAEDGNPLDHLKINISKNMYEHRFGEWVDRRPNEIVFDEEIDL